MNVWHAKIYALVLALVMMPGSFEFMENAAHLLARGHLAHVAADGDQHQPPGPEHGCTPLFHVCACHTGLAFLGSQPPPAISLRVVRFARQPAADSLMAGFWPTLDRPPQV